MPRCLAFLYRFACAERATEVSILRIKAQSPLQRLVRNVGISIYLCDPYANYDTASLVILPTPYIGKNLLILGENISHSTLPKIRDSAKRKIIVKQ